jgi:secreted trypsin-like serine protease
MGGLWAIGFGLSEAGAGKRRALTLTAEGWGCDGTRPRTTGCLPEGELVVPGHPGGDTCIGDSGGPLLEFFVSNRVCMPRLLGITSRRTANATSACGSGGIYTRADTIAGWIDEGVARLVSRTPTAAPNAVDED